MHLIRTFVLKFWYEKSFFFFWYIYGFGCLEMQNWNLCSTYNLYWHFWWQAFLYITPISLFSFYYFNLVMCIILSILAILDSCLKSFLDKNMAHNNELKLIDHIMFVCKSERWNVFDNFSKSLWLRLSSAYSDEVSVEEASHVTQHTCSPFPPPEWEGKSHCVITPQVHTWSHWSPRLSSFPERKTAVPAA